MATTTTTDTSASLGEPSERSVHTYHCLCTQLILATTTTISTLSTRSSDKSHICTLPTPEQDSGALRHYATLLNTVVDEKPMVLRLEDGFEKRYAEKCARCDLVVGYHLDKSQYEETKTQVGCREDVVYLLPGGLLSTAEMQAGKKMDEEIAQIAVKA